MNFRNICLCIHPPTGGWAYTNINLGKGGHDYYVCVIYIFFTHLSPKIFVLGEGTCAVPKIGKHRPAKKIYVALAHSPYYRKILGVTFSVVLFTYKVYTLLVVVNYGPFSNFLFISTNTQGVHGLTDSDKFEKARIFKSKI